VRFPGHVVSTAELLGEPTDLAGDLADVSGEHPPDLTGGALRQVPAAV
jgi:hypothetical protein